MHYIDLFAFCVCLQVSLAFVSFACAPSPIEMVKPKNPFKKWEVFERGDKVKYFLCTFDRTRIHAATVTKPYTKKPVCSANRSLFESYPMLTRYMGEPSLYSLASVEQWLQNVIDLDSTAFAKSDADIIKNHKLSEGNPWCFILFCSNIKKQKLPLTLYATNGFNNGQVIVFYHGIAEWKIVIEDGHFVEGWQSFCRDNLINECDMVFFRNRGTLSYDILPFSHAQSLIMMPWSLPLPMLPRRNGQQSIHKTITSSINPFISHDCRTLNAFYQFYTPKSKYVLELPKHADYALEENKTPAITLHSGKRSYTIGMTKKSFSQNWNNFVTDHSLQEGEVLVFLPQSSHSFAVVVFNRKGIENMYPWHHNFCI